MLASPTAAPVGLSVYTPSLLVKRALLMDAEGGSLVSVADMSNTDRFRGGSGRAARPDEEDTTWSLAVMRRVVSSRDGDEKELADVGRVKAKAGFK
jgi:hypothetical protein